MCEFSSSQVPVLILAAGQSSRMRGRDKLLEDIDGVPLLLRQVRIARDATSANIIVTLPPAPHPRHDLLSNEDVMIVQVPDAQKGLSASLRAGIRALPESARAVMILLADLPDLQAEDLRTIFVALQNDDQSLIWRGATDSGAPGHPIVFERALFAELCNLEGDAGGARVVKDFASKVALIPLPGERARQDLDTPEDWASWRRARKL